MKNHLRSFVHIPKRTLVVAMALTASLVALSAASSAFANEFTIFADCPLSTPELSGCVVANTESGEVTLGKKTVPIENVITLQGGFTEERETGALTFVGAADGNTLSKTAQTVPGGLLGVVAPEILPKFLREIFNEFINKGPTGVTATTELAAPASSIGLNEENLLDGTGIALSLPVKIKLSNPFLGEECYIGSSAHPIVLNLTTGTTSPPEPNEPIKGKVGIVTTNGDGSILTISENSLVNNSFAAPRASGCGGLLSILVDPAVNAEIGLPAAAGHNTAILNNMLKQAGAETVKNRL
jgi:hypothetical protein